MLASGLSRATIGRVSQPQGIRTDATAAGKSAGSRLTTQQLCVIGATGALSFLLMLLQLPTPFADFLKYEPSDVPPALCAIAMGPLAGFLTVLLRGLLRLMTSVRDPLGLLMNIAASGTFVVITGFLAGPASGRLVQLRALAAATVAMTLLMVPVNYLVLSAAGYVPHGEVATFVCFAIVPFNLLKGVTNAVLVLLSWGRLKHGLGFR